MLGFNKDKYPLILLILPACVLFAASLVRVISSGTGGDAVIALLAGTVLAADLIYAYRWARPEKNSDPEDDAAEEAGTADAADAHDENAMEHEISCGEYRDRVTAGAVIDKKVIRISFTARQRTGEGMGFWSPSCIIFDSEDRHVHSTEEEISDNGYIEYAEVWFDDNNISTAARKLEVVSAGPREKADDEAADRYEILASRYEDHIRLVLRSPEYAKELTIALPNSSQSSYIALTGENCEISEIKIEETGKVMGAGDIERIADAVSFIDRMESDLKNVQVDRFRSDCTEGTVIEKMRRIRFNSRSLPGADKAWHCPFVLLYSSKDGKKGGAGYRELALIKLNGDIVYSEENALNRFTTKKEEDFPGWNAWKKANADGLEYEVLFIRKKNMIQTISRQLGVVISNITTCYNEDSCVYAALTGDRCALTDIRVD